MQRKIESLRQRFTGGPRIAAAFLATIVLVLSTFAMIFTMSLVTVSDTYGATHTLLTTSRQPEEIIQLAGMDVGDYDMVEYTVTSENTANIHIHRAFPVNLHADGTTTTVELVEGTVGQLLELCNVQLGQEDYAEPALHTPLTEDLTVKVYRVSYSEEETREELHPDDVASFVETLEPEEAENFKTSNGNIYDVVYKSRFVNGELETKEILSLSAVIQPREAGSTAFVPGVPCSTIAEFDGISMGPDGLPTSYTRKMEGAITTAYSSSGGRGSSGLGLYCGTVAVNPNVIPYGTRLFITSADGSFVYGFAIATDTGTALMEGIVDIDLYFATNAECMRFGKRALDVYILD